MEATFRQRSAALRREVILEAAIEVFARRGFHRSTIRDVARAAGVSDGSIYNVFENKNALLLGILDPLGEAEHDPRSNATPLPESSNLKALIHGLVSRRWATFTPKTLPMLRIVLSEVLIDPTLRAMFLERVINPALTLPEQAFEALAADGRLGGGDVKMTLRLITASFLGLLMLRLLGDDVLTANADAVPEALSDLLFHGLQPTAASKVGHGDD